jgi:hypothetical protein
VLFSVWVVLFVLALVYIGRYSLTNPYVDEWDFIPVLLELEPAGPWLWELHNEHRFPLPRAVYIGLFRLTGDLRVGCLVSLLAMSLLAAGMMRLARQVRGRASICDAVFPLMLMHVGAGENLYMGYQMCFMLMTVLAGGLLAVMARTSADASHFRIGLLATVLGWLLLTCGAGGLAYGVAAAAWSVLLAIRGRMAIPNRLLLVALALTTPAYIVAYSQGYVRPSHHPESAGIYESIRVGLQSQAMALGPSGGGLWPFSGVAILIVGLLVIVLLVRMTFRKVFDHRAAGLLMFVIAGAALAFGIGWGRSGFHNDMGLAWRYGWITVPPILAAYFAWLLRGGRVSQDGPFVLFVAMLVFMPVNEFSGFWDAEQKVRVHERAWEEDVRAGSTATEVTNRRIPEDQAGARPRIARMMRLMRDHRYTYYESLGRESP